MNPRKSLRFIDLFAGLGGFRVALSSYGENCVFSSEWDKHAALTYQHNFNELPFGDITKIAESKIPEHDVLCAGFPCQAFSISGKQKGFEDTRGTLFFDIARIAKFHRPKVLFLENVKNLARHDDGKTLKTILKTLDALDYTVFYQVINASQYGVPQSRERIYIVAFHKKLKNIKFKFPKPNFKKINIDDIKENNVDIARFQILRNDIKFKKNMSQSELQLFTEEYFKPIRVGTISKGGQGERIYSSSGHAITLSAYGGGVAGKTGAYLIDNIVRQLTPRECLRVQGFPDSYKFPKEISVSQAYKLCGNSVSVPVISEIYNSILKSLN